MKRLIIQSSELENVNVLSIRKFLETFFSVGEQFNNYLVKTSMIQKEQDALGLMLADMNIE